MRGEQIRVAQVLVDLLEMRGQARTLPAHEFELSIVGELVDLATVVARVQPILAFFELAQCRFVSLGLLAPFALHVGVGLAELGRDALCELRSDGDGVERWFETVEEDRLAHVAQMLVRSSPVRPSIVIVRAAIFGFPIVGDAAAAVAAAKKPSERGVALRRAVRGVLAVERLLKALPFGLGTHWLVLPLVSLTLPVELAHVERALQDLFDSFVPTAAAAHRRRDSRM